MFRWFKKIERKTDELDCKIPKLHATVYGIRYEHYKGLEEIVKDLDMYGYDPESHRILRAEHEKLKAIVAELCDYVYKD